MALYARISKTGNLELVNDLGINLGSNPEEILDNLQNQNYDESDINETDQLIDNKYSEIVREIDKSTPARHLIVVFCMESGRVEKLRFCCKTRHLYFTN